MPYIVSTATTSINFSDYHAESLKPGQLPTVRRSFMVLGGANLPDKTLRTPKGVVTPVSHDDLAFLVGDANFCKMVKDGFMQIVTDERDMPSAVRDMTAKDRCAPKTPEDYELVDKEKNRNSKTPKLENVGREAEDIWG